MLCERGVLARSLAGHDAGTLYVVTEVTEGFAWVADGRLKTAAAPKKKNLRHLQLMRCPDKAFFESAAAGLPIRDDEIRRVLKTVQRQSKEETAAGRLSEEVQDVEG